MGVGALAREPIHLVVGVLGDYVRFDCLEPRGFEFHPDERSQDVLEEHLIDVERDALAGRQFPVGEVCGQYPLGQRAGVCAHSSGSRRGGGLNFNVRPLLGGSIVAAVVGSLVSLIGKGRSGPRWLTRIPCRRRSVVVRQLPFALQLLGDAFS